MRLGLALAITILSALPLHAEGRFALVIAASDYDQLRDLKNPVQDVTAIAAELDRLGFEVTVETERDARRTRRALEDFAEDAEGADIALVYYAGHGVEIAGENHLLPVDADATSAETLAASAIPLSEVAAALAAIAPAAILLVDACRDDPFAGTALAADARTAKEIEGASDASTASDGRAIAPGFARMGRADGLLYAFATAPGAVALDGSGANSPYAEALLRHLGKSGLSLPTILTLVAQDVYDRSDNRQLPYFESALPDLVFLNAPPADLSERDALLLAMAGLTPDLRSEVERIAAMNEVPLAPLYAAMLSADLAGLTLTEREAQLTQAAVEYRAFIAQTASLGQDDPRITALREEAAELMRLGAYRDAQEKYAQALSIGESRAASATEALMAETLSLVETLKASATAAKANLDHATAIERYRQIADALAAIEGLDPPDSARRARTNALWSLGDVLRLTGNLAGAGAAYEDMRQLVTAGLTTDPQNPDLLWDLAVSLDRLGDLYVESGNLRAAEAAFIEGLATIQAVQPLAEQAGLWQHDISVAWSRIGNVRLLLGDLGGAEAAHVAARDVMLELLERDPHNTAWQRELSVTWGSIAAIRMREGDGDGAALALSNAHAISRALAELDPNNAEWQRDLKVSLNSQGDFLLSQGDLSGADAAYAESLEIAIAQAANDPQNLIWQWDLSVGHAKIGDVRLAEGHALAAEIAYTESLAIRSALTETVPENRIWQRDLALIWHRLGEARSLQGNGSGGLAAFEAGNRTLQTITAQDPQNAGWQRDLSVSFSNIGDLRWEQGDVVGAEAAYSSSLAIARKLADKQMAAVHEHLDLVVALSKLARVAKDRETLLREALSILEGLQSEQRLPPANAGWIDWLRSELAAP